MGDLQDWGKRISWERRVKSLCKPCWELRYCPYGPLVEQFPLNAERNDKSCRIFGHDCPVFFVAEPLTETRELRNVSRNIARVTQFRVVKRDNQICRVCGLSVRDEDIEFDHIIPYSKGGSSDENNIRLLCSSCNRKKSNNFEDEHLVRDFREHTLNEMDFDIMEFLLEIVDFYHEFLRENSFEPNEDNFIEIYGKKDQEFGRFVYEIAIDVAKIFKTKPFEIKTKYFDALKLRWGFDDGDLYTLAGISEMKNIPIDRLIYEERYLVLIFGWNISLKESVKEKWRVS